MSFETKANSIPSQTRFPSRNHRPPGQSRIILCRFFLCFRPKSAGLTNNLGAFVTPPHRRLRPSPMSVHLQRRTRRPQKVARKRRLLLFPSRRTATVVGAIRPNWHLSRGWSHASPRHIRRHNAHTAPTGAHERSSAHSVTGPTLRWHSPQLTSGNGGGTGPPIAIDVSPRTVRQNPFTLPSNNPTRKFEPQRRRDIFQWRQEDADTRNGAFIVAALLRVTRSDASLAKRARRTMTIIAQSETRSKRATSTVQQSCRTCASDTRSLRDPSDSRGTAMTPVHPRISLPCTGTPGSCGDDHQNDSQEGDSQQGSDEKASMKTSGTHSEIHKTGADDYVSQRWCSRSEEYASQNVGRSTQD